MKDPAASLPNVWIQFSRNFHQDFFVIYDSVEVGIEDIISHMPKNDRRDLAAYISNLLNSDLSNSDFKRIWNKSGTEITISGKGKSGAFKSFFQLVLDVLEDQSQK